MSAPVETNILDRFTPGYRPIIQDALATATLMDRNAGEPLHVQSHVSALTSLLREADIAGAVSRDMGPIVPGRLGILLPSSMHVPPDFETTVDVRNAINKFAGEKILVTDTVVGNIDNLGSAKRHSLEAVVRVAGEYERWPLVVPLIGLSVIRSKAEEKGNDLIKLKLKHAQEAGLYTHEDTDKRNYWEGLIFGNQQKYGIMQFGRIAGKIEPYMMRVLEEIHGSETDLEAASLAWDAIIGAVFSEATTKKRADRQNDEHKRKVIEPLMENDLERALYETFTLMLDYRHAFQEFHTAKIKEYFDLD